MNLHVYHLGKCVHMQLDRQEILNENETDWDKPYLFIIV